MTHITPTVGRIVYFRGSDGEIRPSIVTAVHGDFSVNLFVFPNTRADQEPFGMFDDVTHADPEQEPGCFPSWHWMPYQKQQAEKHAQIDQLATNTPPAPGAAYAGYSTMQPHQQRVVDEKASLDDKLTKLRQFFGSAIFSALPDAEQSRLRTQQVAMSTYSDILGERIAAFAPA
jgi:hypothetical protein